MTDKKCCGSGSSTSGIISPNPDPDRHQNGKSYPDRHQNDADPQHWWWVTILFSIFPIESSFKIFFFRITSLSYKGTVPARFWGTKYRILFRGRNYRSFKMERGRGVAISIWNREYPYRMSYFSPIILMNKICCMPYCDAKGSGDEKTEHHSQNVGTNTASPAKYHK
jgi:hypothetical protein